MGGPWATGERSKTRLQQAGPLWGQSKHCSDFWPCKGPTAIPGMEKKKKKALGRPYLCLRFLSLPVSSFPEEAEPGSHVKARRLILNTSFSRATGF